MKIIVAIAVAASLALAGCSGGGQAADLKKNEVDALKNPPKEIPKEAIEAMQKMGQGPNENTNIKVSPKGNY